MIPPALIHSDSSFLSFCSTYSTPFQILLKHSYNIGIQLFNLLALIDITTRLSAPKDPFQAMTTSLFLCHIQMFFRNLVAFSL